MKFLQKLGKALMLPVAILPICGILMGIGYRLCPATMQGGDIQGAVDLIGLFLVKAGGALIDNMAILFAIGVGVGMSEKNDGTGGIAALASWLMMKTLLATGFVTTIIRWTKFPFASQIFSANVNGNSKVHLIFLTYIFCVFNYICCN